MKYALGIDIGGTNTRVALIDENHCIVNRVQFPTNSVEPKATLESIKNAIHQFNVDHIIGIGISCPGPLDLIKYFMLLQR